MKHSLNLFIDAANLLRGFEVAVSEISEITPIPTVPLTDDVATPGVEAGCYDTATNRNSAIVSINDLNDLFPDINGIIESLVDYISRHSTNSVLEGIRKVLVAKQVIFDE